MTLDAVFTPTNFMEVFGPREVLNIMGEQEPTERVGFLDTLPEFQWLLSAYSDTSIVQEALSVGFTDPSEIGPLAMYPSTIRNALLRSMGALQLENRCRENCSFCGLSDYYAEEPATQFGVPELRTLFSKARIRQLFHRSDIAHFTGQSCHVGGESVDFLSMDRIFQSWQGYNLWSQNREGPCYVTCVPRGSEEAIISAVEMGMIGKISLTPANEDRLLKCLKPLYLERQQELRRSRQLPEWDAIVRPTRFIWACGEAYGNSEHTSVYHGIGCFQGVLATPTGMYNIAQVPVSDRYPDGECRVRVPERMRRKEFPRESHMEDLLHEGIIEFHRAPVAPRTIKVALPHERYVFTLVKPNGRRQSYELTDYEGNVRMSHTSLQVVDWEDVRYDGNRDENVFTPQRTAWALASLGHRLPGYGL